MATITEKARSRSETVSADQPSATLEYLVLGASEEDEVHTIVQLTAPALYRGLPYRSYTISTEGGGHWDVEVHYDRRQPTGGGPGSTGAGSTESNVFSWDMTGGTARITQAKYTQNYARGGEEAPDFENAIGVNGDSVEGCDIVVPSMEFTLKHRLPAANVTLEYLAMLYGMRGKTNRDAWKGFPAAELLFLGSSGEKRGNEDPEVSFKFLGSANVEGLYVGGAITGIGPISKWGHEFLWTRYEDGESANTLIKRPRSVHVARVYDDDDFAKLGIGV